jgi:hypothetical protein
MLVYVHTVSGRKHQLEVKGNYKISQVKKEL